MNIDIYKQYGIDYSSGLERFMGDVELYETVLRAFIKDSILEKAESAYKSNDMVTLGRCVHELKGASGNAGMTELYNACSELVLLLKSDDYTKEELEKKYMRFADAYTMTQNGVRITLGDGYEAD